MARKKLPPELKAKNHTFKLYDWEVDKVKGFIKRERMFQTGLGKNEIETEIKKCFKANEPEINEVNKLVKLLKDIDRLLQMHDCGWCDDIGGCCDDTECTRIMVRKKISNYFDDVHTVRIGNIEVKEVER